jgi:hypothetical protein
MTDTPVTKLDSVERLKRAISQGMHVEDALTEAYRDGQIAAYRDAGLSGLAEQLERLAVEEGTK